jgi:hypothetical protein
MERKNEDLKKRTALDGSGVARVLDVTGGGRSSDEDGHGGNGEESDFGEHFKGLLVVVVRIGKLIC